MADLNANLNVVITSDAPPVGTQGFGVPLWAGSQGGGFTERIRFYDNNTEVQADTDLSAAAQDAGAQAFSQSPRPARIAMGRVGSDVAQVDTVTYAGTTASVGETFDIVINGTLYQFTASGGETPSAIAAAIAPLVNADPDVGAVDSGGGVVTITASVPGEPFTITEATTSATITSTPANLTPNTSVITELQAILAEDDSWYGFAIESRVKLQLERASAFAVANNRLFAGQTSDADTLTSVTTDVMSVVKATTNRQAFISYRATDAEKMDFSWLAKKLATDPDQASTQWSYATLVGITADSQLTATEKNNILGKNGNVYLPFYGVPVTFGGRAADGTPLDVVLTMDWLRARISEGIAQRIINASNAGGKIPYTDPGITQLAEAMTEALERGENTNPVHLTPGSSVPTIPLAADVSAADKTARLLRLSFVTEAAGAIERVNVNGNVAIDL